MSDKKKIQGIVNDAVSNVNMDKFEKNFEVFKASMEMMAKAQKVKYDELIKVGFNEDQALKLCK
jgi:hypothetical protein